MSAKRSNRIAILAHDFADREALAEALAVRVAADVRAAIAARGMAVIALSGGTTPRRFFERLALQPVDWPDVVITLCDERWVPPDNERSNARLLQHTLLRGSAARARFVPLHADAPTPEAGLAEVERRIDALPLPLDVVVLGMGLDGHTASFFPDGDRLAGALTPDMPQRVCPMHAASAGEPRITLTLPLLAGARAVYLLIEGADKKALLDRIVRAEVQAPLGAVLGNLPAPLAVYWSP